VCPRQPESRPVRVLLADDHRLFREGVASLLDRVDDVVLVGAASTGEEAVALARELTPDIVLMDLDMPGVGGIAATRLLLEQAPGTGVIALTMLEDDASLFAALDAGARGYVLKDAERGELLQAIRAVARGGAALGPKVTRRVLDHLDPRRTAPATAGPFAGLTPRETEILDLIAVGKRNADIARALFISDKTVGNHISSIFAKLGVTDRVEAVIRAREAGLGQGDSSGS